MLLSLSTKWSVTLLYGPDEVVSNSKFNLKASLQLEVIWSNKVVGVPPLLRTPVLPAVLRLFQVFARQMSEARPIYHLLHCFEHMKDDKPLSQIVPEIDGA